MAADRCNKERQRYNNTNEIRVQSIQFGILSSTKTQTEKELREKKRARREAFQQIIDREELNDKKSL